MLEAIVICIGSICGLELWRRHLVKTRPVPGWFTAVTWGLFASAGIATVVAWFALQRAFDSIENVSPSMAKMVLAEGISGAMRFNAVAVISIACAAVLLGVWTLTHKRR